MSPVFLMANTAKFSLKSILKEVIGAFSKSLFLRGGAVKRALVAWLRSQSFMIGPFRKMPGFKKCVW